MPRRDLVSSDWQSPQWPSSWSFVAESTTKRSPSWRYSFPPSSCSPNSWFGQLCDKELSGTCNTCETWPQCHWCPHHTECRPKCNPRVSVALEVALPPANRFHGRLERYSLWLGWKNKQTRAVCKKLCITVEPYPKGADNSTYISNAKW